MTKQRPAQHQADTTTTLEHVKTLYPLRCGCTLVAYSEGPALMEWCPVHAVAPESHQVLARTAALSSLHGRSLTIAADRCATAAEYLLRLVAEYTAAEERRGNHG